MGSGTRHRWVNETAGRRLPNSGDPRADIGADLQELAETLPALIFVSDTLGAVYFTNRHFQEITGLEAGCLRGHGWIDALHPDDQERARLTWQFAMDAEEPFFLEVRVRLADGGFAWHLCKSRPVREAGQILRWVGSFTEVVGRTYVSDTPGGADGVHRTTFDHAASGIARLTPGGCVLAVNDRVCEILGLRREDLVDRAFQAATHPEDLQATVSLLQDMIAGRVSQSKIDKRYLRPDGSVVWARVNVALVRDEAGEPDHLVLVIDDITAEKAAEVRERQRVARSVFLRRLGEHLRAAATAREAVTDACELIGREMDLDLCAWCELQDDGEQSVISSEWRRNGVKSALGRHAVARFGTGSIDELRAGHVVRIDDFARDPRTSGTPVEGAFRETGIRAALKVPFRLQHRHGAILLMLAAQPRQWSDEEVELGRELAELVSQAAERAQADEALRASERRFRAVFENASVGIGQVDLGSQRSTAVNDALCRMLGYTADELLARHWTEITHPDDVEPDLSLSRRMAAGELDGYTLEKRYLHKDGHLVWGRMTLTLVRDALGRPDFEIGVIQDITEQKAAEAVQRQSTEAAQAMARTDALTGLPNRTAFTDLLSHPARAGERAVLFLDVNSFKRVNDSLGHAAGDHLIMGLAQRLRAFIAPECVLARVGGDEFIFVLTGAGAEDRVRELCAAVHEAMLEPLDILGRPVQVRLALGYAVQSSDDMEGEDVIRQADLAMYEAKRQKRGEAVGFGDLIERSLTQAAALEQGLRHALQREGELFVVYQPIFDRKGRLVRAEALARWTSVDLGVVPPDRFIKVAEGAGLMIELGRKLFHMICRDLVQRPDLRVSVNISPVQLTAPDFVPALLAEVEARKIDPARIELELTEAVVVEDAELVASRIGDLRSAGFTTALDDFGTGYSSLGYLQQMGFDTLKIDRSFVTGFASTPKRVALLSSLIVMAHSMDLRVVCEGVETEQDCKMLKAFGCDYMQGYHLGRPTSLDILRAP